MWVLVALIEKALPVVSPVVDKDRPVLVVTELAVIVWAVEVPV